MDLDHNYHVEEIFIYLTRVFRFGDSLAEWKFKNIPNFSSLCLLGQKTQGLEV